MSESLLHVDGYKHLQTYFPTLTKIFRLGRWSDGGEIWMDNRWRVSAIDCSGTAGPCTVQLQSQKDLSGEAQSTAAFLKVTHLLDPVLWMRGEYGLPKEAGLPWYHKAWQRAWQKLQDPGNQAYVDAVATYALGRLREEGLSPHFNLFYGTFCARADVYRYNLTDDFQSYRHERWFWRSHTKGLFSLRLINEQGEMQTLPEDLLHEFQEAAEADEADEAEEEELEIPEEMSVSSGSLESADAMDDCSYATSESEGGSEGDEGGSEESEESFAMYAEFTNYPVMLILMEKNTGTMDTLFDDTAAVGASPGTPEWDIRWTAWLFQIIAALSCMQATLGFTHNDLHTNNIVWSDTPDEYIFYKTRSGSVFRVPTFGKIFRIIDFGRAIFKLNGQHFISDDFKAGHDAEGQYSFEPLVQRPRKVIPPNPSFDLCRLAVSLMDGIFTKTPKECEQGAILSTEDGLIVKETESRLYNLLWSWLIDDEGRNIFINADGSERFPDFDLYRHIAAHCFKAVPSQQFHHAAFDIFQLPAGDVPVGTRVYSLFC
jgi:hypothetical protein